MRSLRVRLLLVLAIVLAIGAHAARADTSLLNVSYDPTRELYAEFNPHYRAVIESHKKAQEVAGEKKK